MAKYYIRMEELKTDGEEIQDYAKNVVDANIQELINLVDKFEWEGPTYEMFITLYTDKIQRIKYLAKMIEMYGKFMVAAADEFTEVNNKFVEEMQVIMEQLRQQNEKLRNSN